MKKGLTDAERKKFVAMLMERGWTENEGIVCSPDHALWFDESHFNHWTLEEFHQTFDKRAVLVPFKQDIPIFRQNHSDIA